MAFKNAENATGAGVLTARPQYKVDTPALADGHVKAAQATSAMTHKEP